MDLHTNFTTVALAVLALGALAAVVSVGVITGLLVSSRRERLARHESLRTYYRRFVLAH